MIKKLYLYLNKDLSPMVNFLLEFVDLVLFGLVAFYFLNNFVFLIIKIYNLLYNHYYDIYITDSLVSGMVATQEAGTSTTTTTIIHINEGWAQGIKTLYIYGAGALQLHLMKGGTPLQKGFVIAGTIAADTASTAFKKAINDPDYVEKHINSWKRIMSSSKDSVEINVSDDSDTLSKLKGVKENFLPDNLNDIKDELLNKILEILKPILEPVSVDYSNAMLANQIYVISIMLFILCLMIVLLIIAMLMNMFIFVYTDRLKEFFTNKYIRAYITLNKKIIGIEIFVVGTIILYFMFNLSYGLHFLATHPIDI
uniref:hypothetical protein n=1 Tax=Singerocybe alboinfundibuliformis TaxID=1346812 RepID=UPI0030FE9B23